MGFPHQIAVHQPTVTLSHWLGLVFLLLGLDRLRNRFFMAATEAFRRGQGMAARDLARRGRDLNTKMKEKHTEAARDIFHSRNPGDQVRQMKHRLNYPRALTRDGLVSSLCRAILAPWYFVSQDVVTPMLSS